MFVGPQVDASGSEGVVERFAGKPFDIVDVM
jgi:hypothetical protein